MSDWYAASTLAGTPGMPATDSAVIRRAKRESWKSRPRTRGKGREYHIDSLPKQTRLYLLHSMLTEGAQTPTPLVQQPERIPAAVAKALVVRPIPQAEQMSDWQRSVRDARAALLVQIEQEQVARDTRFGVVAAELVDKAAAGTLDTETANLVSLSNTRAGDDRVLTVATLYRWRKLWTSSCQDALAPLVNPPRPQPAWLNPVLQAYQRPSKPSVSAAYAEAMKDWPIGLKRPSKRTVERHIATMPAEMREYGRMLNRAKRAIQPFVRRTTDGLWPMDVVSVDGHSAKCWIMARDTGRRMRPEITTYIDIATRKLLSYSVWMAESQYSIWLALRTLILDPATGVPAIQYSDRGAYKSEGHKAVLARLGITPMLSIAYRPQSRGAIERINSSVWIPLAKSMPSYGGDDMDDESFKRVLARFDKDGSGLPAWDDFLGACAQAAADYNARPHPHLSQRGDSVSPNQAWQRAMDEGWAPTPFGDDALFDLLPALTRQVTRGEISTPWGRYANPRDLAAHHGRRVSVRYDPADGARVWVCNERGELLCIAQRDGNAQPYVHSSQLEHARAQREQARIERKQKQINGIRLDETPVLEGETYDLPDLVIQTGPGGRIATPEPEVGTPLVSRRVVAEIPAADAYLDRLDTDPARYEALLELRARAGNDEPLSERERQFLEAFSRSGYCRAMDEMRAEFDRTTGAAG